MPPSFPHGAGALSGCFVFKEVSEAWIRDLKNPLAMRAGVCTSGIMWMTGCWGAFTDTEYFTSLIAKPTCVKSTILWNITPPTPQSKASLEEVILGSQMGHKGKEKWRTQTSDHSAEEGLPGETSFGKGPSKHAESEISAACRMFMPRITSAKLC